VSFDNHANLASASVATAPTPAASGTTLVIDDATGWPTAPFPATIYPSGSVPTRSNAEIVYVTGRTGTTLTITRAQEGTSARTILVGDAIAVTLTVKTITDIETAIPSTAGLLSNVNVSAGSTSNNLSAFTFSNLNGVSFGLDAGTITATVRTDYQSAGAYLTTAALSQDSSKYAGTNGAITGGSITVNTSGVSINLPAYLTTAMQSDAATLSNIKVSAGGSSAHLSALTFSNSNGVSFGLSNGTVTATVATNYQSQGAYLTTARGSTDAVGLNTAQSNVTWTVNSSGLSLDARGYAGTGTSATNASVTLDSNGLAISVGQGGHNLTLSGNTAGVMAQVSTGTLTLAGGNNITLSQNGNAITISGANAAGAQTAISGIIVSDATYTSGTVSFSNAGNITINSSVNGATQYIKLSGNAAQTTQSAIKGFGVSNTGNTAGNTGISTGIDWVMAGSGSITLSQSTAAGTNTIWIQHPAWLTTARGSTDAIGLNTAKTNVTWTVNSSGLSLDAGGYAGTGFTSGGNNIGISGTNNTAGLSLSLTVAAQSNQSAIKGLGVSNTGQTAGNTGLSTGIDWVLAGSQSITLSQSTTAGGPNTIWFQHPAWLTTARRSTDAIGLNTAQTNVTWTVNSSGLSLDAGGYAGTGFTSAGANVGLSGTHNTAGLSLSVTVAAQTNQSAIKGLGVSNTGQTAGNTGLSTGIDWVLAGSQSITLSQSTTAGGPNTIWFQHPAWLTTARRSTDAIGLNTAQTNVTWTVNSSGLSLDAGGYAGTVTGATGASLTVNTAGVSVNVTQSNQAASASNGSFAFQTIAFSNANNVTFGTSAGSIITASVAAPGAAAENNWFNLAGNTTGNTTASGSTIALSGGNGVTLSGTNNSVIGISVSTYNTLAVTTVGTATSGYPVASANSIGTVTRWAAEDHRHAGIGALGISTGNTLGTSGTVQGTYWLAGSNNISVSQITSNNGSHTAVIVGQSPMSYWRNAAYELIAQSQTLTVQGATSYVQPLIMDVDISASYIRLPHSFGVSNTTTIATSANATGSCSILSTLFAMLYTRGTGASSQSLQSYASGSVGMTAVWSLSANANGSQWTLSQSITHPITGNTSQFTTGVTTSLSNYSLGSLSLTAFTGLQFLDIPFATLLSRGNYWLALGNSSTTNTGGSGANFTQLRISASHIGVSQINSGVPPLGQASNSTYGLLFGHGSMTTNAVGTTASYPFANVSTSASQPIIPFAFVRIT
jgi:hypothetical protein